MLPLFKSPVAPLSCACVCTQRQRSAQPVCNSARVPEQTMQMLTTHAQPPLAATRVSSCLAFHVGCRDVEHSKSHSGEKREKTTTATHLQGRPARPADPMHRQGGHFRSVCGSVWSWSKAGVEPSSTLDFSQKLLNPHLLMCFRDMVAFA